MSFLIALLVLILYSQNIVKCWLMVWHSTMTVAEVQFVLRAFGIFILPIGVVMGLINLPLPKYSRIPRYVLHFGRRSK